MEMPMTHQLEFPGFVRREPVLGGLRAPLMTGAAARVSQATALLRYPDVTAEVLCARAKELGQAAELQVDSTTARLGIKSAAFPFAGILFEEYNGSVTLSNGASERLIPTGEGIAFPLGTFDTFTTYGGPANLLETANTIGLPLYARQMMDAKGRWIDLMTEASILPVNKRPRLAIRLHSSN